MDEQAVKSALRVLEILDLLASAQGPMTFTDLAQRLGYPRSSLHGLLGTLVDAGWAERSDGTRRYTIGIRAWEAGSAYLHAVTLAERARPYMARVRDALDETVQLAVLDGRYNVYVAKVDGAQRLVLDSQVGRRLQAHATGLGKVLLAGLPDAELDRAIAGVDLESFTPHTITNPEALRAELTAIRRQGYGLDNEEYTIGVRCVAVPVRDHSDRVAAAMSVSVPMVRFDEPRRSAAIALLLEAADGLATALGHHSEAA